MCIFTHLELIDRRASQARTLVENPLRGVERGGRQGSKKCPGSAVGSKVFLKKNPVAAALLMAAGRPPLRPPTLPLHPQPP